MALTLHATPLKNAYTTLENARCALELKNDGSSPVEVPFLDDSSGVLTGEFYAEDGRLVRRVSALSQHVMLSRERGI
jgi:hypothetical protein